MKSTTSLLSLTICLSVLVGYNFMSASWTSAPTNPPSNNAEAPINVSATTQTKAGRLNVQAGASMGVATTGVMFRTNGTAWANMQVATAQMRSPQYCDELGANCFDASEVGGGVGTWGTWTDIGFRSGWRQNARTVGVLVRYTGARDNSQAYVSPTGTTADQVQVTSHDGDGGERSSGTFIVPPGHYYNIDYGATVAELRLPF